MRILFLSAHPAVSLSDAQGYAIRIKELVGALGELGHEVIPLIAGDQRARLSAQRVYKQRIKRFLPPKIAQILRELFFLVMDRQFYLHNRREVERIAPDVILERYSFFNRTGMWLASDFSLPLVLDDISPTYEEEIYFQRALRRLAHRIQDQVFARADALIAVSTPIREYLIGLGIPPPKIFTIHNGADCVRFSPEVDGSEIRERFGLADQTVVGFVGGFLPWQGVEALVDAALEAGEKVGRVRFLLVGPSDHWSVLDPSLERKMVRASTDGSVIFTGPLPHHEIPRHLAAMDIVTVPDFNDYGCPIKIFEYMAMGKPLIAPQVPSIAEIVTHGQDGWLMEKSSTKNLMDAIEYLSENPGIRRQLGLGARQTALQKFTWSRIAEQLESVLESVSGI